MFSGICGYCMFQLKPTRATSDPPGGPDEEEKEGEDGEEEEGDGGEKAPPAGDEPVAESAWLLWSGTRYRLTEIPPALVIPLVARVSLRPDPMHRIRVARRVRAIIARQALEAPSTALH